MSVLSWLRQDSRSHANGNNVQEHERSDDERGNEAPESSALTGDDNFESKKQEVVEMTKEEIYEALKDIAGIDATSVSEKYRPSLGVYAIGQTVMGPPSETIIKIRERVAIEKAEERARIHKSGVE